MQTSTATFLAALYAHDLAGGSYDITDVVEVYAADYVPAGGFDPADAEVRFCGIEGYTFLALAYQREYTGRSPVSRYFGKKENACTTNFSNVSRELAVWVQQNDIEGKQIVVRVVSTGSSAVLADSLVIHTGRLDKPGDLDDGAGSLISTQRFGRTNQKFPVRNFGPNDPKRRSPSDPLFEGFRITARTATIVWTTRVRRQGPGGLIGLTKKITHSFQASSQTDVSADLAVPDAFGRVQVYGTYIGTLDIGGAINCSVAICEGGEHGIDDILAIKQINPKFTQISQNPAKFYGYPGGQGPVGRQQLPIRILNPAVPNHPGDGYHSRTAWFAGFVSGSSVDIDEAEAPDWMILIKAKRIPVPDGSGDFNSWAWTHNPAYIARYLLSNERYFNEGEGAIADEVCWETGLRAQEYILDESQGERVFIPDPDAELHGSEFSRFRSTSLVDARRARAEDIGDLSDDPHAALANIEPFDPGDPPDIDDLPDPTAAPDVRLAYLRERHSCNATLTEEMEAVDFLNEVVAPTGRLYFVRNGQGKIEIREERPADHSRLRAAASPGASSLAVTDVFPWKSGLLLAQSLLVGNGLTTSERREVTAANYTADGNGMTLVASGSGDVTATASGATLSGGSTSVPASGTITLTGTPAGTITVTINGLSARYQLDSNDTLASAALMLARFINATPKLGQFVQASCTPGSTTLTVTAKWGTLTLNSALANSHSAEVASPTTAPTVAAAASGVLYGGTYYVGYAYRTAVGPTALSPVGAVVVTNNQRIVVTGLGALPAGVVSVDWYVSKFANSRELVFWFNNDGSGINIGDFVLPDSSNELPPDINESGEELIRVTAAYAANDQDDFTLWRASTSVALNGIYLPTAANGHKYKVTTAGTTGGSEPAWPTASGGTVASGTAVFTEFGPTVLAQAGLARGNIHKEPPFRWPLRDRDEGINKVVGTFFDATEDYAATPLDVNDFGHQARTREENKEDVDLSGFDNYRQASSYLNFILSKRRDGALCVSFQTGPAGMLHEEGDVICVSASNAGLVNMAARIEELKIGPPPLYNVGIVARVYTTRMFSDRVRQHTPRLPTTLRHIKPLNTLFQFIDLPPWREADAGLGPHFQIAAWRDPDAVGSWKGYSVWVNTGAGYVKFDEWDVEAVTGATLTALPDHAAGYDRTNTVRVQLKNSANVLTSATDDEIRAGKNLCRIRQEILQYKTATLVGGTDDTYDLSGLLVRGRLGTEGFTAGHAIGDDFTVLDGTILSIPLDPVHVGKEISIKLVTVNQDVADATPQTVTWLGYSRLPLAIARVTLEADTGLAPRDSNGGILTEVWPRTNADTLGDEYEKQYLSDDRTEVKHRVLFKEGAVQPGMIIVLDATKFNDDVSGDSIIVSRNIGGSVQARTLQLIRRSGNFVAATLRVQGSNSNKVHFGLAWAALLRNPIEAEDCRYRFVLDNATDTLKAFVGSTEVYSEDASSYIAAGKRVSIEIVDTRVLFFVGEKTDASVAAHTSEIPPDYPLAAWAKIDHTGSIVGGHMSHVRDIRLTTNPFPVTLFTPEQQEHFYGELKSPIQIRIRQKSTISGLGYGLPFDAAI